MRALFVTTIAIAHLYGISPRLLHRIFFLESGYGKVQVSTTGCCWGPGHVYAEQWGVSKELLLDLAPSVDCSAQILSLLLNRYNGDTRKAVAAYTGGYNYIDRLIKQSPLDWFRLLDPSIQNYVTYVLQRPQAGMLRGIALF